MSGENARGLRFPIAIRATSRRHIEERIALRFPRLVSLLAPAVWRLPRRSWLRRTIVRRALRFVYEAANRRDYQAMTVLYHPDGEMTALAALGLGFDSVRGRSERIRLQEEWADAWGEFRFKPEHVIDLGDRVLIVGRISGSGLSSGVAVENEWGNLFTVTGGRAVREQVFFSHAQALKAAGLSE